MGMPQSYHVMLDSKCPRCEKKYQIPVEVNKTQGYLLYKTAQCLSCFYKHASQDNLERLGL